ncbi:UEV-domain-containing protein, partial [Microthyrium microscopicum]
YQDPNRTYNDVARTLSNYPSLTPRTDVYTFENGSSALLLLLNGTIPVEFRGQVYRFPVQLWIPQNYPREGPIAYVVPAQDMAIRPGQHVAGDGRVYHPYLAQWGRYWDKSSLFDFVTILRDVFAKDPPVMSKQQATQQASIQSVPIQPAAAADGRPPPVPPPPQEYRQSIPPGPSTSSQREDSGPPPPPPKGGVYGNAQNPVSPPPQISQHGPPPIPPLPQEFRASSSGTQRGWQPTGPGAQAHGSHQPNYRRQSVEIGSSHNLQQPPGHPQPLRSPLQHEYQGPPKPPPVDLLTSPLDVTIPSQTGTLSPLPAPPIPPNPEKDALLHALSSALVAQSTRTLDANLTAITPLLAQQAALRSAHATLSAELQQLTQLDEVLAANEHILRSAMRDAENVRREASGKSVPEVDELLVCPSVVGSQLYTLVADVKGIEEARMGLTRALDRGRVGLEVWARQMRGLGREEFLKKALGRKIARGMGLDERRWDGVKEFGYMGHRG